MPRAFLRIHPADNACVALVNLPRDRPVAPDSEAFALRSDIPAKHKFASRPLEAGDAIVMYGSVVGRATEPICRGELLTTLNVAHDTTRYSVGESGYRWSPPEVSRWRGRSFNGYHRSDGQVGTSNRWLVIPLVFCENRNVHVLRSAFEEELGYAASSAYRSQVAQLARLYRAGASPDELRRHLPTGISEGDRRRLFENVDGIHFLTHEGGCGGTREDAQSLCGLFAGYLHHPNVAGATVLSLGCENAQLELLEQEIQRRSPHFDKPLLTYRQQDYASVHTLLSEAVAETFASLAEVNSIQREPAPLSRLTLGLECGGSDGFSGLSANPAMGHAADMLVALGGRAILAEFPELCGVEQALIDRCTSPAAAERFVGLMQRYASLAEAVGSGFDMNPSPGNIRDGLLTDAMKSAGAARKGGMSPVRDVLDYPEYATEPGLNLLCTPGGDVESTTAIAGAGAQVILFSTGLGTPTGNPVASVIKISSNSALRMRMPDIIDLDAGGIVTGAETIQEVGERILDMVVSVAGGIEPTKADLLCQFDFIPWKRGVSL